MAKLNVAIEFRANCLEAEKYFEDAEQNENENEIQDEKSSIKIEIIKESQLKVTKRKKSRKKKLEKFECKKCQKSFSCRYYLHKHEYAVHTEINISDYFECDSCVYKSKTKSLMRSHQINNHSFSE